MTEGNYQDNLDRTYIALSNDELIQNLAKIIYFMSKRVDNYLEESKETSTDNNFADSLIKWHCYCCGHSWSGYDKTNPEAPEKCPGCGRSDYKQTRNLCKHDKNCKRCLKKKTALLELVEKIKSL